MINEILNHPLVWLIVIVIPLTIILKKYFTEKFDYIKMKTKTESLKTEKLQTIAGKVEIAIDNPLFALNTVKDEIKAMTKEMNESNDPNIKEMFKKRIQSKESTELKIAQFIADHANIMQYGKDLIVPTISTLENRAKQMIKGFGKFSV